MATLKNHKGRRLVDTNGTTIKLGVTVTDEMFGERRNRARHGTARERSANLGVDNYACGVDARPNSWVLLKSSQTSWIMLMLHIS